MRIELSVAAGYVNWGISEGIREFMQNAIDAETLGSEIIIDYDKLNTTLRIKTKGVILPHNVLLMGATTKKDDNRTIGKFGEGLKLGCMAIMNSGLSVVIQNGGESWVPAIEKSVVFDDSDVLVFNITEIFNPSADFEIIVKGLVSEEWDKAKAKFSRYSKYDSLETPWGEVILDSAFRGHVYSHGIFVENISDEFFKYGYNLSPGVAEIDRDRKLMNRSPMKKALAEIWKYLAVNGHSDRFFELSKSYCSDLDLLTFHSLDSGFKEFIQDMFFAKHGKDAVADTSTCWSYKAKEAGKILVPTSSLITKIIEMVTGEVCNLEPLKPQFKVLSYGEGSAFNHAALELARKYTAHYGDRKIEIVSFEKKEWKRYYTDDVLYLSIDLCGDPFDLVAEIVEAFSVGCRMDGWKKVCWAIKGIES